MNGDEDPLRREARRAQTDRETRMASATRRNRTGSSSVWPGRASGLGCAAQSCVLSFVQPAFVYEKWSFCILWIFVVHEAFKRRTSEPLLTSPSRRPPPFRDRLRS